MSEHNDHPFFDEILNHLRETRGFDFGAYKRASLMRRVIKRMQTIGVPTFEAYLDHLQVDQDEFGPLFNTILINVTSFFRDPEVWSYIAAEVVPEIVARTSPVESIRIWSAGCASGAEPYTVAMLLAEQMGAEDFRERVKIYATDLDEEALAEARLAVYTERQIADVPAPLVTKYFDRTDGQFAFSRELRRAVIFGRHDLLHDAPISRVDLLLCRNTLMYFQTEAQARIIARFYFSLKPAGFVLLGRAEMLSGHGSMFLPVDLKQRVFRPVPKANHRDRLLLLAQAGRDILSTQPMNHARLREAAFQSDSTCQIILDAAGTLAAANSPARQRFDLTDRDIGRPVQDLEVSYRPTDLRDAIDRALAERRDVTIKDVRMAMGRAVHFFDVTVAPLHDGDEAVLGTRITFHDITEFKSLQAALQHSKQELEAAYEELQSTNEELETTNEELQSTVEELETTNEELQSTNEELETMNEELQSTNEELQTMNEELRNRSSDLNAANSFLESMFASLQSAVVVVDREFRVQVWNHRSEDLWGVRPNEVQNSQFLGLDIGLPVSELHQPIRDVLTGAREHQDVTVAATSRRGKSITCRVTIAPLRHGDRSIRGAILLMEERRDSGQETLQ
jgi:two-component system CheB/CheR fusion protein